MEELFDPLRDAIERDDREKVKALLDGLGARRIQELVRYPNWLYALVEDGYVEAGEVKNSY